MNPSFADAWLAAMGRACWQGGLALALAWAVCRAFPKLPAAARCWVWRLAYLKVLVALLWAAPVELPLLRPPEAPSTTSVAAPRRPAPAFADAAASEQQGAPLPAPDPLPTLEVAPPPPVERPSPATALLAAWSVGLALVALRLVAGFRTTVRLRRVR
jgi:hypothetical protein